MNHPIGIHPANHTRYHGLNKWCACWCWCWFGCWCRVVPDHVLLFCLAECFPPRNQPNIVSCFFFFGLFVFMVFLSVALLYILGSVVLVLFGLKRYCCLVLNHILGSAANIVALAFETRQPRKRMRSPSKRLTTSAVPGCYSSLHSSNVLQYQLQNTCPDLAWWHAAHWSS